jgi:predicted transcriptional regulator of viral defense system
MHRLAYMLGFKEDRMRYSERMPTDRFAGLAEVAADQHGLFTLDDARAIGYAENTIAQMARRGRPLGRLYGGGAVARRGQGRAQPRDGS